MADDQVPDPAQSDQPQQQDPRGDLLKARPGGDAGVQGKNPNTGFSDEKPDSDFKEGGDLNAAGSEGSSRS
ncbi:MAG: hypothetical protein QOJ52_1522 [Acidimicrobiaceae bacterium]|jgi:hypothetical protein|nr:hypothetical protein [Acidimicrobiaceae bacterium]MDQ1419560.1 hypothetical protein [Acidimicrobiaceae bacterium]MDQ1440199.1 hypothetical protein [Acidimicrobiaceae bacterium]